MNWVNIVANPSQTGIRNSAADSDGCINLPLPSCMKATPTKQRRMNSANASLLCVTVGDIHVHTLSRIIITKRIVSQ